MKMIRAFGISLLLFNMHLLKAQNVERDSTTLDIAQGKIVENINSDKVEYAPSVSADGKTMVFETNKSGKYELYESRFANGEWGTPISIDSVNNYGSPNDLIGGPSITFDGNTMYFFSSFKGGKGAEDIYYSIREEHGWSSPKNIGGPINSELYEGFPSISADGRTLYFVRFKPEGPSDRDLRKFMENQFCFTIYKSEKGKDGSWSEPIRLPEPVNRGCEKAPRIMADSKTLIFSSMQLDGMGGYDMYQSQLNDAGDWTFPVSLDYVNSKYSDQFASISAQGDKMYYAFNSTDIYAVDIPEEFQQFKNNIIQGYVREKESGKGLATEIFVTDAFTSDEVMHIHNNPNDGRFSLVLAVGRSYNIEFRKEGYTTFFTSYDLTNETNYKEVELNVNLYESAVLKLNLYDIDIFEPLEANIKITEVGEVASMTDTLSDSESGALILNLPLGKAYQIEITKEHFKPAEFLFDISGLTIYPEFEHDIELIPIKKEVNINITDITNNSKVRSRVRIRNRNRNETIDVEGNETVSLRVGDRYEIEATSDQGYAFNSTEIDMSNDANTDIVMKLQPLIVGTNLTLKDILFESNSDQLTEASSGELNRVITLMFDNPTLEVEISAHTDDLGSEAYNKILSGRRAKSVVNYLIENEIQDTRFVPVGYGESEPLVPNEDDNSRSQNRRVVLKILAI
ncbi:MAG: PD40 domain-containing protein [Reichenbachiella sp.]